MNADNTSTDSNPLDRENFVNSGTPYGEVHSLLILLNHNMMRLVRNLDLDACKHLAAKMLHSATRNNEIRDADQERGGRLNYNRRNPQYAVRAFTGWPFVVPVDLSDAMVPHLADYIENGEDNFVTGLFERIASSLDGLERKFPHKFRSREVAECDVMETPTAVETPIEIPPAVEDPKPKRAPRKAKTEVPA